MIEVDAGIGKEEMLKLLSGLAEGIAAAFGRECETLIQDLNRGDIPTLAIYNGHVSGREVGSNEDIYGNQSKDVDVTLFHRDMINLMVERGDQKVRSTTIVVRGRDYCLGFGINMDITRQSRYADYLREQLTVANDLGSAIDSAREGRLAELVDACLLELSLEGDVKKLKKVQRQALIALLQERNAFEYHKAVPYISERLGVSRFTVYNDLKELG